MTGFYKTLFERGAITGKEHTVISRNREDRVYTGKVDFLTDGDIEFQWAERDGHCIEVHLPDVFDT